ncbi:MAG TPA: nodulation protein NfeD [Gaiellales bacterium]|nr:nodulation protein NfeD [Gaiellales bacterium]
MRTRFLLMLLALACLAGATPAPAGAAAARPLVLAIRLNAEINPVSASFVSDSIDKAKSDHAVALVILLDTPGGLSTSMDDIIQDELHSPVPVIVYVAPTGARAASAGAVITMASDVAAMAPTTHIGAATPIDASGQNIGSDLKRKIENDAEAQIRGLAKDHHRNPRLAQLIVRKATEYTASEALHGNLIEHVARSLPVLLDQLDGTTTAYTQKQIVLHTAGARIETLDMPWTLKLLNILIDPNLLYLLFLAGIAGIAYEVFHPGVILPGTLGGISLILALFGFSVVPINLAGVALIIFGVALIAVEGWVTSHGLIGISGVLSLTAGGLMLFRTPGSGVGVNPLLVVGIGIVVGGGLAVIATKVISARHQPVSAYGAGAAGLLGQRAIVRTALRPRGQVFVHGELWEAEAEDDDGEVTAGSEVVVDSVEGLTLRVSPVPTPTEGAAS